MAGLYLRGAPFICILAVLVIALVSTAPAIVLAAQDTPTPEPTQEASEATPTAMYVILITPTPQYRPLPPSLTIKDLKKNHKGNDPKALYVLRRISPLPESPVVDEIDQAIYTFMPWLISQEEQYRSITGRFVQMLPSHIAAIPGNGEQLLPDGWYTRPTDQQWSWDDLNAIRYEELPFAIYIDTYFGMEGPGFVACFQVGEFQRCINYGPEALRNQPWKAIEQ